MAAAPIPVVLFAYARPAHLARVLACLRENRVPLILAFADGAKGPGDAAAVAETRALLRAVDWSEVRIVERAENLGLGRNVIAGVTEAAADHEAFIVWEDDLICVPGTYAWMSAALRHYAADSRVLSVSAWTHPRVTPGDVGAAPYFDGRADCWVWGAWARSWRGMKEENALTKSAAAGRRGVAADAYGADLPAMARQETRKNIWAVRWLYHHLEHGGLCLRPPWSMVEHIGFDPQATHAAGATEWANPPLRPAPPVPAAWPGPVEHPECRALWAAANPPVSRWERGWRRVRGPGKALARALLPEPLRAALRGMFGWRWFEGDFASWAEAKARCEPGDTAAIAARVLAATQAVREGRAAFERDSVQFARPEPEPGLIDAFRRIAGACRGPWHVIDFGGALGTTFWRHREELGRLQAGHWDVVEQGEFVALGRTRLADSPLRFFESVAAAGAATRHDVIFASTSLQYLEDPAAVLAGWMDSGFQWVLLNNLPLHSPAPDRIAVQRVPPEIYPASQPVWFFNRGKFLAQFAGRYEVAAEFASEAVWQVGWRRYPSTGLLLRRISRP
jgi:putative methyltransferase (TIGR04325 family)